MTQPFKRLHHIIQQHALNQPNAIAFHGKHSSFTYQQLQQAIDEFQKQLAQKGLQAGDRLLLVGENEPAQLAAIFAASALDAIAVVINARLTAYEVDTIQNHADPRLTVYTHQCSPEAKAHAQRHSAQGELKSALGALLVGPTKTEALTDPSWDDPSLQVAVIIYTTGTTGAPKGVMLTHTNLLFSCANSARSRLTSSNDVIYAALPISHVYGLTSVALAALWAGASLIFPPRFTIEEATYWLKNKITIFQGVPAMYGQLLTHHENTNSVQAPHLRFCYIGGAALDADLKQRIEAMVNQPIHNGYGLTEASPTISQIPLNATRADTSVGYVIPQVTTRIVDKYHQPVTCGEIGELWVKGPNIMKGYYKEPGLTAEVLNDEGWLRTGDLARQDEDGALFIVGRIKELIIRSGFNVYPNEVESILNAHPNTIQSAVVGKKIAGNEEIVAFIEVRQPHKHDEQELHSFLKQHLAPYKRPQHIRLITAMPQAPSGKILRKKLIELVN